MLRFLIICIIFKVILIKNIVLPYETSNEYFNHQRFKRVVGGIPGKIEDFPFLVSISLLIPEIGYRYHFCGGTIITQDKILTAGHCTDYEINIIKTLKVRAGSSYWKQGGVSMDIKEIIRHEHFNSFTFDNDIAILILSDYLPFNKYINSIPLATKLRLPGTFGLVMGWGLKHENAIDPTNNFNVVNIPLVDLKQCQEIFFSSHLQQGIICAGYVNGGKDACNMDSGGPFIEAGEIIGIVSLGMGCARPNRPGVYTNVVYLHNWILNKLNISST